MFFELPIFMCLVYILTISIIVIRPVVNIPTILKYLAYKLSIKSVFYKFDQLYIHNKNINTPSDSYYSLLIWMYLDIF
jgi:hypothetical protein